MVVLGAQADPGEAPRELRGSCSGPTPPAPDGEDAAPDDRRDEGSDEDADLDDVVLVAAGAVGELADEQGDGGPDAGHEGQAQDVRPPEAGVETDAGEPGDEEGRSRDADGLADDDADRDAVGEGRDEPGATARVQASPPAAVPVVLRARWTTVVRRTARCAGRASRLRPGGGASCPSRRGARRRGTLPVRRGVGRRCRPRRSG